MYTLSFSGADTESYWNESFDKLVDAIRAAHEYGTPNDFYHVYDFNHKLIFTGRL